MPQSTHQMGYPATQPLHGLFQLFLTYLHATHVRFHDSAYKYRSSSVGTTTIATNHGPGIIFSSDSFTLLDLIHTRYLLILKFRWSYVVRIMDLNFFSRLYVVYRCNSTSLFSIHSWDIRCRGYNIGWGSCHLPGPDSSGMYAGVVRYCSIDGLSG